MAHDVALRKTDETARCARCERWLPHTCFGEDASTPRGLRSWCKECEYKRVLERGRRDPVRKAARAAVAYALRTGKLSRGPCELEDSGDPCKGRIEAHHDDYQRKLDVRWLCVKHHRKVDSREPRTLCVRGLHSLSGDNLYVNPGSGKRQCRACTRIPEKGWSVELRAPRILTV